MWYDAAFALDNIDDYRTKLYGCVQVSVQQSIGTMIQDCPHIAVEAKRRLLDILTDEFEKLRRFVTLFNMPVPELEVTRPHSFRLCIQYVVLNLRTYVLDYAGVSAQ